jgi:hypothetical protein
MTDNREGECVEFGELIIEKKDDLSSNIESHSFVYQSLSLTNSILF